MRAILISAGQGTRLIPLTLGMPKCLVPVDGRSILDWQLDALRGAGFDDVVVIGGYKAAQISEHIAGLGDAGLRPRLIFNPFWSVSSSIGSVWAARDLLDRPFCIINGDLIFTPELLTDALGRSAPGVNLVIEHAPIAEHDDMRVEIADGRIARVDKRLSPASAEHRSLGIIVCGDAGHSHYVEGLGRVISQDDGPLRYHHDIIDALAQTMPVNPVAIDGHDWLEIDRPEDIAFWKHTHVDS